MGTKSIVKLAVALYNSSVHSSTSFTPNEIIFNNNNNTNPIEIINNAEKVFREARINMYKSQNKQRSQNHSREDPPPIEENQEVFIIPNIRSKREPRANETKAHDVGYKTFLNERNVKRHKGKIKRVKKSS